MLISAASHITVTSFELSLPSFHSFRGETTKYNTGATPSLRLYIAKLVCLQPVGLFVFIGPGKPQWVKDKRSIIKVDTTLYYIAHDGADGWLRCMMIGIVRY